MKVRLVLTAICLSLFAFANAQEETSKINYANISEGGIITASPRGVALEATSINGLSINKHHVLGLGFGIGISYNQSYVGNGAAYTPIFVNYRYYFKPDRTFTPHINTAIGGLLTEDGGGLYVTITAGFRVKRFSFSSGISMMSLQRGIWEYYEFYDPYTGLSYGHSGEKMKWFYPFGFVIKLGFSF